MFSKLRQAAKAGHAKKISAIKASETPYGKTNIGGGGAVAPYSERVATDGAGTIEGIKSPKRLDRAPRRSGGRLEASTTDKRADKAHGFPEGSPQDKRQDEELAKRMGRAHGGRVGKGKATNVTIVIGQPPGMDKSVTPVPMPPVPIAPPANLSPPPIAPAGPGMPPMTMRARGGKVDIKEPKRTPEGYPRMDYGALTGQGRLQKIKAQS